jgi:hypothetical protein
MATIGITLAAIPFATPALAMPRVRAVNNASGIALRGYDTVAWFAEGAPRRGSAAFAVEHAGANWHFANARHQALFAADPAAFAPAFGGFCAFGVARGYKVDIDPEAWHIEAGVLYLNYDRGVQRQWRRDIPGHIARAVANWPRLAEA